MDGGRLARHETKGFIAVQVIGPDGGEIAITSVSGADFSSVEAVGLNSRQCRFGIAVTCYDEDGGARKFVSATGEIDHETLTWLVDYCGAVLDGSVAA